MAAVEQTEEEGGAFTQAMRVAYHSQQEAYREYQQLKHDYAKALQEIDALRADLRRLQSGVGVFVEIDGKRFTLGSGLVTPEPEVVTITPDWLKDQPQRAHTMPVLTDTLSVFKD